jgi:hypothetical protein
MERWKLVSYLKSALLYPHTDAMLSTGPLRHCGVMVNYRCTAACRHCLYACSPSWSGDYMSRERAAETAELLRRGGCPSVHIGGGEPFLDFEKLLAVIRELNRAGIGIDYIETNAFWASEAGVPEKLRRLAEEGIDALCISLDPYHAEYVPYGNPLRLAGICERSGMGYFLWKREFLPALSALDASKAHSRASMEKAVSAGYVGGAARSYGISYGGRAVNIEDEFNAPRPAGQFEGDLSPCGNLLSTGHFHVDWEGFFIPPGCTGIRIPLPEAAFGIPEGKYPAFEALYAHGVAGLCTLAREQGFEPRESGYASKCGLCFYARAFLAEKDQGEGRFPELNKKHYEESMKY